MRKNSAHFSEIYLHKPEQLDKLEAEKIKFFWAQRSWHPVIKMNWVSGIASNGEGQLIYPDGSIRDYEMPSRGGADPEISSKSPGN